MKTIAVNTNAVNALRDLQVVREEKNVATISEKEIKKSLVDLVPELEDGSIALTFKGNVVATQAESFRNGIDSEKLATEYPEAFEACQKPIRILTLKVTL